MKSQKGVTLISLTIYIIAFAIVIGIIATISGYFYGNLRDSNVELDPISEFITFNTFFSKEINTKNIESQCGENGEQKYIVFIKGESLVQYTFTKNAIFRNNIKICKNIDDCSFSQGVENGKQIINVLFKSGNYTKNQKYIIQN